MHVTFPFWALGKIVFFQWLLSWTEVYKASKAAFFPPSFWDNLYPWPDSCVSKWSCGKVWDCNSISFDRKIRFHIGSSLKESFHVQKHELHGPFCATLLHALLDGSNPQCDPLIIILFLFILMWNKCFLLGFVSFLDFVTPWRHQGHQEYLPTSSFSLWLIWLWVEVQEKHHPFRAVLQWFNQHLTHLVAFKQRDI